jgi:hypothetical protein
VNSGEKADSMRDDETARTICLPALLLIFDYFTLLSAHPRTKAGDFRFAGA